MFWVGGGGSCISSTLLGLGAEGSLGRYNLGVGVMNGSQIETGEEWIGLLGLFGKDVPCSCKISTHSTRPLCLPSQMAFLRRILTHVLDIVGWGPRDGRIIR